MSGAQAAAESPVHSAAMQMYASGRSRSVETQEEVLPCAQLDAEELRRGAAGDMAHGAAAQWNSAMPAAMQCSSHRTAATRAGSDTMGPGDTTATWDGAELAALAAAWDAAAIDRCIIQAHDAQYGYGDEEELGWLRIPEDWPRACAPTYMQVETASGDAAVQTETRDTRAARTAPPTEAALMQTYAPTLMAAAAPSPPDAAPMHAPAVTSMEWPGSDAQSAYEGHAAAHTPTELYSDVEQRGGGLGNAGRSGGCELMHHAEEEVKVRPTELYSDMEQAEESGNAVRGGGCVLTYNAEENVKVRQALAGAMRDGPAAGEQDVESVPYARVATANAAAANSGMALDGDCVSGAPSRTGGGAAQHPDVLSSNAALWAYLGDPSDALAWGGA